MPGQARAPGRFGTRLRGPAWIRDATDAVRPRTLLGGCLLAGVLLFGCDLGRDTLYGMLHAAAAPGDGASVDAALGPGSLIELYRGLGEDGACVQCMQRECSDVEADCLADDFCRRAFLCRGACRDFDCFDRCGAEFVGDPPLGECKRDHCSTPCRVGKQFDCAGRYQRTRPPAGRPDGELHVRDAISGEDLSGVRVQVCQNGLLATCDNVASAVTNADGVARVPLHGAAVSGYFELTRTGWRNTLQYAGPYRARWRHNMGMVTEQTHIGAVSGLGGQDDPTRGIALVSAWDCVGAQANGLSFSASRMDEDTVFWYGALDPLPTRTLVDGIGGFGFVSEGMLEVRATRADTGQLVARRRVWIRAGWTTLLVLAPGAEGELDVPADGGLP